MRFAIIALAVVGAAGLRPPLARAADPPLAAKYLYAGELAKGEQALERAAPGDDQARFGLGVVRFLRAVERLGQSFYEYGAKIEDRSVPFFRLPLPKNPDPNRIGHAAFRRTLDDFHRDLDAAERAFAGVKDDGVKLPLELAEIRLDLTGGGRAGEKLTDVLRRFFGRNPEFLKADAKLRVTFDRADASWFRGYCHLLMGLTDFLLAFDGGPLFECLGHVCFTNPRTGHAGSNQIPFNELVAAAQNLRIREPDRLKRARRHLLKVCELSADTWKRVLAEADDDHEWLPGPKQQGVFGVKVTREMIDSWLALMAETTAVLEGKKLIPSWAAAEAGEGVNVKKLLESPPEQIDLIEWATKGAKDYREKGQLVDPAVWGRAEKVFGGEFMGFAVWFN